MTILEETMNKLLRDVTNLILEEPEFSIKAKQDAPRPITPYAVVDFISDTPIGWDEVKQSDQSGPSTKIDFEYSGSREIMFSIMFLKDLAVDNARRVWVGLARESISSLFSLANIGLGKRSMVREISINLEGAWEERAQFDITLNTVGTDLDIVESIGSIDISGEFQARGLKYNFNVEVTA